VPARDPGPDAGLGRYLDARARLVERSLAAYVPPGRGRLRRAIRYSLLGQGKRIRPILTLAAAEAVGARARAALPFACALEMIHTYSLVHDDLPAMDDDDVRRGRPSSHRAFGEGLAILVGDALLAEAFRVLAGARGVPPPRRIQVVAEVAAAAGEAGMVGGQALDLAAAGRAVGLAQVREIHRRKTGAMLCAAVRVGALVGGAGPAALGHLTTYGRHLGLAFQIADDLLDHAGGPDADGRTDRRLAKATYPAVMGIRAARRAALRERDAALAALRPLPAAAAPLRAIATWIVARAVGEPAGGRG
jgi:geranylgeranyl diphosphate synthase type II